MFLLQSEAALLSAFRPRDRKALEAPLDVKYPAVARDYFSWVDPTGVRAFLVLQEPGTRRLMGIVFRRDQSGGGAVGAMCEWCHTSGAADQVGLITAERSSKKRVGVLACRDLRCRERIEEAADLAGRQSIEARKRVVERMLRFAHQGLGIERVPGDVAAPAEP